ncbi:MAG: 4-hydroxy-tetrahydrodipicolinate reductase [Planctomycetes bacterium]|nr:4-hydroxy-tetrahydrodipicolinate reductase [Planctomycetota bacterium]MCB9871396.1 4-hydroxy-tetrahydrodipicolinate reductase [Planctomycetota bacterium]MCB9888647.1 4-hydroxy-tetrahydrodipicolinate reductase [Planctomycetota bacterium]
MTIRVHVHGALGRMGRTCVEAVQAAEDLSLCGSTDVGDDLAAALAAERADVAIEFTVPEAVEQNVRTMLEARVPVVAGTTGLPRANAEELGRLAKSKGVGFLLAPNFAIGVVLMQRFAREAVRYFKDVEIVELHHDKKLDAPSGTALHTADELAKAAEQPLNQRKVGEVVSVEGARGGVRGSIPIHSIRLPGLLAHQEVIFGGQGQVLTIRHDALDRHAFMPGVLLAVRSIHKHRGLVDSLEALL